AAPLLELRPVTFRDTNKAKNDRGGQGEGQRGDEIERRGRVDGVQQLVHGGANPRRHLGHTSRREGARRGRTETRVSRWVQTHHGRLRRMRTREEDPRRLWHEWHEREL